MQASKETNQLKLIQEKKEERCLKMKDISNDSVLIMDKKMEILERLRFWGRLLEVKILRTVELVIPP